MAFKDSWNGYFRLGLCKSPSQPTGQGRRIPLQLGNKQQLIDERRQAPYISNAIRTNQYTIFNFLPRQLVHQFSRVAHAYLMVIAILQLIPDLSTTGKFTTIIPLSIFIILIIVKEGYYDWKKHRADTEENRRKTHVLQHTSGSLFEDSDHSVWVPTEWQNVHVGDIVKLSEDEDVPADIVLLGADGDNGFAYVDTMALDGETNLKAKQPLVIFTEADSARSIGKISAEFSIEDPNADLYRFDGTLKANGNALPIKLDQVIYRGSTLRNTQRAVCIVINTGEECKIRMNAKRDARAKKPAIEGVMNRIVFHLMLYVLLLSVLCTLAYFYWLGDEERELWYLFGAKVPFEQIFLGFIIMFNQIIPLSLYVGLEAIKLGQMALINGDLEMYHAESDNPARVNNPNIVDDMGQISHIFTDKTGTLTENMMNLRRISVGGASLIHKKDLEGCSVDTPIAVSNADQTTDEMLDYIKNTPVSVFSAQAFRYILSIALCHTCIPKTTGEGELEYQGSSPDEVALARAAKELGFIVTHRNSRSVTVAVPQHPEGVETVTYEILDTIEFTSDRKRMSIILRSSNGGIWLICKGADSIVLPRLVSGPSGVRGTKRSSQNQIRLNHVMIQRTRSQTPSSDHLHGSPCDASDDGDWIPLRSAPAHAQSTVPRSQNDNLGLILSSDSVDDNEITQRCVEHVESYAEEGLRTLIYAERVLDDEEYESWKKEFKEAETSLVNRQELMDEISDKIEQNLHLLGASAVEDKLQEGVPETIEKLRRAGIKICMLTGDKRETAINIAHSTRICKPGSALYILDATEGDLEMQLESISGKLEMSRSSHHTNGPPAAPTVLVVDGGTLNAIEEPSAIHLRPLFYALLNMVDSTICCRASPSQKSLLVASVRNGVSMQNNASPFRKMLSWFRSPRKPLTLAIGDGANDVAMILTASVGVGISGKEGQQASRVADFSISQFRYLSRLLLVHGRHNYYRTTLFILTTFWKEIFVYLPQALYQDQTNVTGTSLYYPTSLIFVSILTGASMVVIGVYDQDLEPRTLLAVPELYAYGQGGEGLNMKVFFSWVGNALLSGVIVYRGTWHGYVRSEIVEDNGLYAQGALTFIVCIIWINLKILFFDMHYKTKISAWSAFLSILALWLYHLIISISSDASAGPYSVKAGMLQIFGRDVAWWMSLIWSLGALMLMEIVLRTAKQNRFVRLGLSWVWALVGKSETGGGVRPGFQDWEPRLWQEMENDPAVSVAIDRLQTLRTE
ncbi:putative phospholipid-transporting ATPase [Paramyrothecium foliicola]|nr:putative phospholipid-transporting ATPase [Paramyrothecium foliicola]